MTTEEQLVWELHVACSTATGSDSFYSPSTEDAANIREYTLNREAEMAFNLILGTATAEILDELRERAYEVGYRLCPEDSAEDVRSYVDGWLAWELGSGVQPPCWT